MDTAMPTKSGIYDEVYGRQVYEEQTGIRASFYKRLRKYEVNRYEVCLQLLPLKVEKLLDAGCGGGCLAKAAAGRFSEYHGVDLSPVLLKQASDNLANIAGQNNISLSRCDLDQGLPFDNNCFDAVSCIGVLEHVMNPPNVIDEIHRVLKPDGVFVVGAPNVAWLPLRIGLLFGQLPLSGGVYLGADWEHLHIFTKKVTTDLLVTKGFEIEQVVCSGVFAAYRELWVSLLGGDIVVRCRKKKGV